MKEEKVNNSRKSKNSKKSSKLKSLIIIIILLVVVGAITFNIGKKIGLNTDTSTTSTTIEEVTVGKQTISKKITSNGEVETQTTEKLDISTTKAFKQMCVETDDIVEEGENILEYSNGTYLTAPYKCVISEYSVPDTGDKATDSNYIEIEDLSNLEISIEVSESELSSIAVDQDVDITLTADSSITYTGKIAKISSVGTYSSSGSTFPVTISFENDGNAKIGMSVSCEISISELTDVIAVPVDAVQINGTRRYVVEVDNGEVKEVDVETGLSDDEYVQITSGLYGGETIQVVTTTTQSTVRSSDSQENSQGENGKMDMPSMGGGDSSSMPSMGGGMPGGGNGSSSGHSSQKSGGSN